jgi:CRP-like cAMP-binding protein
MTKTNSPALLHRLSAVPLFHGLGPASLRQLATAGRRREATRRQCFFVEGEDASDLFVLMSGRVKIAQQTSGGGQFILGLISANQPFGCLGAHGRRYSVTAEALQGAVAIAWPATVVRQVFEHDPRLVLNALDFASGRLDELQAHFRQFVTERVDRRVARSLLRLASVAGSRIDGGIEIDFPVSRQEIAEMSGTTLFTVSRLLSAWRRQGFVKVGRQRVVLLKPSALVAIAKSRNP